MLLTAQVDFAFASRVLGDVGQSDQLEIISVDVALDFAVMNRPEVGNVNAYSVPAEER